MWEDPSPRANYAFAMAVAGLNRLPAEWDE